MTESVSIMHILDIWKYFYSVFQSERLGQLVACQISLMGLII